MDITKRLEQRIDEITLKQAYAKIMKGVKKSFSDDISSAKEMVGVLDDILTDNFMWFAGEITKQVEDYIASKHGNKVAKEFMTQYNKLGTRRATDR